MYNPQFRKKANSLPILSKKEINMITERFAEEFSPGITKSPQPFDIDGFLECYLKLTLDFHYLSNNTLYLGMTVFNDTDKVIIYNSEKNEADYIYASHGTIIIDNDLLEENQEHRYRFTLGHECGHWIFHKEYHGYNPLQPSLFETKDPYLQCREVNVNYEKYYTKNWDDNRWMEWQADQFAAGILMPESSVRLLVESLKAESTQTIKPDALIQVVSLTYNVSKQAACYRLRELEIIPKTKIEDKYKQLSLF